MPLTGYRTLQQGSGIALDYCGKLFADFGADVVKLEPPGGDPLRSMPPVLENGESGVFAWLNTNKKSVTETVANVEALLPGADVLLTQQARDDLAGKYPGLAVTAIDWFGHHGPYSAFAGSEAVCRALAGLVALTGPAEGPPILATECQQGPIAGLAAFIATASGLYGRAKGARSFSVSLHETAVNVAEYEAAVAWDAGQSRKRPGINRFGRNYPVGIYETKLGLIGVTIVTPGQWRGICAMLGMPDLAKERRFSLNTDRLAAAKEIDALFQPVWATKTAEEWFELALQYKLPMAVVPTMEELLEQSVHRERGAFVPVRIGDEAFEAPRLPQVLTLTPPLSGGTAPLAGEDHPIWSVPTLAKPSAHAAQGTGALAGLRIVDLTMGWAGPTAARHLGELGAEIIKVEACQYPDWWRGTDLRASFIAEQKYEKIPWFQLMNRNKLDVTLDLANPEGAKLLKRLVATSHAVIENYSAGVLRKLGLDYSVLKDVRPGLVMVSMPAFGSGNAWSDCRAYGSTLEHASGLPTLTGSADHPAVMNQTAYGDPVGGFNAAAALIVALLHQQRTGHGQNIDISQVECMLPLVAPSLIEQSAFGFTSPRIGNRHRVHVPNGAFRCAGDDQWVAIAVCDDTQWQAACTVLNRPDLVALTAAQRRAREDELEALISAWTATRPAEDAMTILQEHGVAAGVVRLPGNLDKDPHLMARGFWHRLDRPFIGPHWQSSAAWREGPDAYPVRRVAPTLGQDNEAILMGMLGLDRKELTRLAAADIIGIVPKPRRPQGDA
jgi:crotonobetainyl-CoA:carnitine CoA-transferase CaiB-like acyl-CoA transferase